VLEESTVTLGNGLTLSYAAQGAGRDVVLLPGPTDSWRSYQLVLNQLPASLRVVALSQRGHGDSEKPATGYRVIDFASDVVQLLDELGIERAVLVGHSGSCLVARRVALDRPDRVPGLILEASPTTLADDARLRGFVESVVSGLEDPIGPDFARDVVVDTSSDALTPALLDELAAELLKVPARVWNEMFADLLTYDDLADLGRMIAPTLLLWGDADALVSRDMQDQLVNRIPGAELRVYPKLGHTPRWEDPARVAADITAFCARVFRAHD
jgi:pimeloyl-ACP methyl ester carboxylesterase